jgi:hypothetical protein
VLDARTYGCESPQDASGAAALATFGGGRWTSAEALSFSSPKLL